MLGNRRGFTLIELLIVILIIGVLAVIALPNFVRTRERSYIAALKSDLRNLATAEEDYFSTANTYTTSMAQLTFNHTTQVLVDIPEATAAGWRATATYASAPHLICELYYGNASGATTATREGVVTCTK
jgi:prepilin-type N-terminal cleavage/methylation domain-containing protein